MPGPRFVVRDLDALFLLQGTIVQELAAPDHSAYSPAITGTELTYHPDADPAAITRDGRIEYDGDLVAKPLGRYLAGDDVSLAAVKSAAFFVVQANLRRMLPGDRQEYRFSRDPDLQAIDNAYTDLGALELVDDFNDATGLDWPSAGLREIDLRTEFASSNSPVYDQLSWGVGAADALTSRLAERAGLSRAELLLRVNHQDAEGKLALLTDLVLETSPTFVAADDPVTERVSAALRDGFRVIGSGRDESGAQLLAALDAAVAGSAEAFDEIEPVHTAAEFWERQGSQLIDERVDRLFEGGVLDHDELVAGRTGLRAVLQTSYQADGADVVDRGFCEAAAREDVDRLIDHLPTELGDALWTVEERYDDPVATAAAQTFAQRLGDRADVLRTLANETPSDRSTRAAELALAHSPFTTRADVPPIVRNAMVESVADALDGQLRQIASETERAEEAGLPLAERLQLGDQLGDSCVEAVRETIEAGEGDLEALGPEQLATLLRSNQRSSSRHRTVFEGDSPTVEALRPLHLRDVPRGGRVDPTGRLRG
ncbi:hypothetical protein AB0L70_10110 [Kribbella sp. NPDC051952]|uniref:hypothetical protein n=1 Tax=Kribbella sp. NPDC051952 TaxID=3154851 RepID=UPI003418C57D